MAAAIEVRLKEINSQGSAKVIRRVDFVCEGEKAKSACSRHIFGQLRAGGAWEIRSDIKQKLVVSAHIVSTQLRPDVIVVQPRKGTVFYRAHCPLRGQGSGSL